MKEIREPSGASCPACDTGFGRQWGADGGTPIYECTACLTIYFARPITNKNNYNEYYPYLKFFTQNRVEEEIQIREFQSKAKLHMIERSLPKKKLRILDLGSGPGYFSAIANRCGHDAVCGELNKDAIKYGETFLGNRFVDIDKQAPGSFDAVTLFHVLEHLENPGLMMHRALDLLRPGGLLYIHVPLGVPASSKLETNIKQTWRPKYDRRGCLYLPDHLTGFSKQGLERLARRFNLRQVRVDRLHMFSEEYDPLFFKFRRDTLRSISLFGLDIVRGLVDYCSSGHWLRCVGHK